MKLALKIDVDTYRGTRESVPRLLNALQRHGAKATFLFSLGPDRTGRAIKRVFRPGFLSKVSRTSVVQHYGVRTLLYGTLLPAPNIGKRTRKVLQRVREEGFETGVHCWDHIAWQDGVTKAGFEWTEDQMKLAVGMYNEVFGLLPRIHGAAGWQMNRHAYRLEQRMGFDFASDTRGTHPFIPVYQGEVIAVPQLPTTLPTFDEVIGLDGVTAENVPEHLLELSTNPLPTGHVFTLHAELEGMKLLRQFERLLEGWQSMGYELVGLRDLYRTLDRAALPHHYVETGTVPGRSGTLAVQGRPYLA